MRYLKQKSSSTLELIKYLAILSMVIDHVAFVFIDDNIAMRFIGRFAYIAFAFLTAYHYRYSTKDKKAYKRRLFIFGVVSQLPFMLIFGYEINILFLLYFGLLIIDSIEMILNNNKVLYPTLIIALGVTVSLFSGYFIFGLFLIPLFYYLFESKSIYLQLFTLLDILFLNFDLLFSVAALISYYIVFYIEIERKIDRLPKYLFYAFYPLHLIILKTLSML